MRIIETIHEARQALVEREGSIGLVPTMGYLHAGHVSLIEQARKDCDRVVVSVFVNPLQFGPSEDLDRYPRDLERDAHLAEEAGADILFTPSVTEMYPRSTQVSLAVKGLSERLCGASRPGHFDGVATVVAKLFQIIQPSHAYFGQKDAQQLAIIQCMVEDLNFPIEIVPCPTLREPDGLAMSSRNVYLSVEERNQATILNNALSKVTTEVEKGNITQANEVVDLVKGMIQTAPLGEIEYVEALTYPYLQPITHLKDQRVIIALAVHFGQTRLIDNVIWTGKEDASCLER
ncbi:pantoate--beta-alanine ligase [Marininema mesophilum]|uniref:Pantothenate synthetase n=1 Tax=Marininema mesophilum TaxID=1048340 RepID=A0A1H2UXH2_9BACL|nr:pantoate--beta-alanine ligase [Marininema mesophilum]SDW60304.1 pantoate--beta-alanine ligase [Marininema mesophilum]